MGSSLHSEPTNGLLLAHIALARYTVSGRESEVACQKDAVCERDIQELKLKKRIR